MSSSPPRALAELAEDIGAGIVVIGSTHRSGLGRIMPGSVGDRLLAGSALPVAIAPRGYANDTHTLEQVAVGFDGREESGVALAFASFVSRSMGAPLKLLAVLAPPAPALAQIAPDLGYEETVRAELTAALEAGEAAVTASETTSEILEGNPAEALAAASARLDLLVVGSRGYGPIRGVLLGDVSAKLVREIQCPAIVVPRAFSEPIGIPAGA
jgi:nucleotide-binding universal stress UspA family protein